MTVDPDQTPPTTRQPILNLPPMVTRLLVANLAVHGIRWMLPDTTDVGVILSFGFIPARYMLPDLFGWQALVSPVTHLFLHGSLVHLLINMVMLMAFGSGVERRIGGPRLLAFALACGVLGAAAHFLLHPLSIMPVIGASGAISGLFGGVLRFLPRRGGSLWPIVLLWIGVSILFGVTGIPGDGGAAIAWAAHVGGFLGGFLLFGLFDRKRRG
ncbi:rhomboid family intramembrane serine protease [Rhodospirillaceae bacterium SYSU D60014]|uniref:rhomboid family intramembrane serine protease n=1 Tax=Virgifigura deserti TaxID=2268457 RepID=UPI000E65FE0C